MISVLDEAAGTLRGFWLFAGELSHNQVPVPGQQNPISAGKRPDLAVCGESLSPGDVVWFANRHLVRAARAADWTVSP